MLIRGLPEGRYGAVGGTALWTSGSKVTILYQNRGDTRMYAVDVGTGQARQVAATRT